MNKNSGRTLLVLLFVVGVVLLLGLTLRELILKDFQRYTESEHQTLVVEGKFLKEAGEEVFIRQLGVLVLMYSVVVSGLVLAYGMFLSRKPCSAIKPLHTATGDRGAKLSAITQVPDHVGSQEVPMQPLQDTVVPAPSAVAANAAVAFETAGEQAPDDPQEADDEDMQPLAGDPDRITRIVKGLDELAKAEALRNSLQKQALELEPILRTLVDEAQKSVLVSDVICNLECRSDLTLSSDPECVFGIVKHLLDNAFTAVKKGGNVTVSARRENEQIVLAVEDTGTGIRKKALPHIFERFYRGSGSGIGLGLAIVKELVDASRGTIAVQTAWGKGSTFTVKIPYA